ncbi:hypothetical protein K2X33_04015 [bacterium]|nr:hypothetical protein [bacterium]
MKALTWKALLLVCIVALPALAADDQHAGAGGDGSRPLMVPPSQQRARLDQLVDACVAGRPAPPFFAQPAPTASTTAETAGGGNGLWAVEDKIGTAQQPVQGDTQFQVLSKALGKCAPCHSVKLEGNTLADAKFSFLKDTRNGPPGQIFPSQIIDALVSGTIQEMNNVKMTEEEMTALRTWATAQPN